MPPTPTTMTSYRAGMAPRLRGGGHHLLLDVEEQPPARAGDGLQRPRILEDPGPELPFQRWQGRLLPVLPPRRPAVHQVGDTDHRAEAGGDPPRPPQGGD